METLDVQKKHVVLSLSITLTGSGFTWNSFLEFKFWMEDYEKITTVGLLNIEVLLHTISVTEAATLKAEEVKRGI